MVFNDNMNDGFTDNTHLEKYLDSVDSQELIATPYELKVEKRQQPNEKVFLLTYHYAPTNNTHKLQPNDGKIIQVKRKCCNFYNF